MESTIVFCSGRTLSKFMFGVVFSLVLFGCSSGPELPQGTYTTTLVETDVPATASESIRNRLVGTWQLTLSNGDRFQISQGGEVLVGGRYDLRPARLNTQEQIVFTDESGPASCANTAGQESGTYNWAFEGKQLTLTTVEDKCDARRIITASHPLPKQE